MEELSFSHKGDGCSSLQGNNPASWDEASEPCSSLGARSLTTEIRCAADGSTPNSAQCLSGSSQGVHTSPILLRGRAGVEGGSTRASGSDATSDEELHERVTINLSSGEDLMAQPYGHSVSGHHVMLKQEGKLWKATRSHREERFYTTMKYCATRGTMQYSPSRNNSADHVDSADSLDLQFDSPPVAMINLRQFLGETTPDEATVRSAIAIAPFVPRFYGMRQVRKLRCQHDQRTPSGNTVIAPDSNNTTTCFPKSPVLQAQSGDGSPPKPVAISTNTSVHRFDAAGPHTAEDIVASFEQQVAEFQTSISPVPDCIVSSRDGSLEADHKAALVAPRSPMSSTNPALRRTTILPSKAPEVGRPLDHRLPRTVDQLVDMIVLEDVCHGFTHPCVLDLKIGTRQYGVNAPASKQASKTEKAKRSTSASLGIRVSGFKKWNPKTQLFEAKSKRECFNFTASQIEDALWHFFGGDPSLVAVFRGIVRKFETAFSKQTAFRFFTSSILLVYDAYRASETARLVMVDFAYTYCHAELISAGDADQHQQIDVGYLLGIESLSCMVEHTLQRALVTS